VQVYQLTVIQLTVVAHDRGPDAMPTDVPVVVRIVDVNDNVPTIIVNTLASRGGAGGDGGMEAEVPENLPAGTFVAHVTVADADSAEFADVDCNVTDSAFSLLRRTDSSEFQVLPLPSRFLLAHIVYYRTVRDVRKMKYQVKSNLLKQKEQMVTNTATVAHENLYSP